MIFAAIFSDVRADPLAAQTLQSVCECGHFANYTRGVAFSQSLELCAVNAVRTLQSIGVPSGTRGLRLLGRWDALRIPLCPGSSSTLVRHRDAIASENHDTRTFRCSCHASLQLSLRPLSLRRCGEQERGIRCRTCKQIHASPLRVRIPGTPRCHDVLQYCFQFTACALDLCVLCVCVRERELFRIKELEGAHNLCTSPGGKYYSQSTRKEYRYSVYSFSVCVLFS